MPYDNLTEYERALARFGDKVGLIAGLEISDKISPEDAYQQIKILYKEDIGYVLLRDCEIKEIC